MRATKTGPFATYKAILSLGIAAVLASGLLAACGGNEEKSSAKASDGQQTQATAESLPSRLTLRMGEWYFKSSAPEVKAGKVAIKAINDGDIVHEIIVIKTSHAAAKMPMNSKGDLELEEAGKVVVGEEHGHDEEPGHADDEKMESDSGSDKHMDDEEGEEHGHDEEAEEGHLAKGERATYKVRLKPGKYVMLCSIPGHYKAGQYASLTVV